MTESWSSLSYEVEAGIGLLRLDRPAARNALDIAMREELAELLPRIRADRALHALIVTGAGGAFCAGGDLRALSEAARPAELNRERIRQLHVWFQELLGLELPVIAAVDGPAFGAGFNLALAADFVLCSTRARFCAVFGRIGLVPDLGGYFLLPRIVGLQRAKELIFTARTVEAEEARALGLVCEVHPPDLLLDRARDFAGRFRLASREAVGLAKTALLQSFHLDRHALAEMEAFGQAVCLASDYHQAAVARFLDKQPLAFDWERLSAATQEAERE